MGLTSILFQLHISSLSYIVILFSVPITHCQYNISYLSEVLWVQYGVAFSIMYRLALISDHE